MRIAICEDGYVLTIREELVDVIKSDVFKAQMKDIIVDWKSGTTKKVIWQHRINIKRIWIILGLLMNNWFSKYQKLIPRCQIDTLRQLKGQNVILWLEDPFSCDYLEKML